MSGKYKVRFHLGKGKHYQQFQITKPDGNKIYYDPSLVQLWMKNGTLVNHPKVAQKIHDGANKTVCSWIECEHIQVYGESTKALWLKSSDAIEARYNPRKKPNWMVNGEIADKKVYRLLFTEGRRVFVEYKPTEPRHYINSWEKLSVEMHGMCDGCGEIPIDTIVENAESVGDYEWEGQTFCPPCLADEMDSYGEHLKRMKDEKPHSTSIREINNLLDIRWC